MKWYAENCGIRVRSSVIWFKSLTPLSHLPHFQSSTVSSVTQEMVAMKQSTLLCPQKPVWSVRKVRRSGWYPSGVPRRPFAYQRPFCT